MSLKTSQDQDSIYGNDSNHGQRHIGHAMMHAKFSSTQWKLSIMQKQNATAM